MKNSSRSSRKGSCKLWTGRYAHSSNPDLCSMNECYPKGCKMRKRVVKKSSKKAVSTKLPYQATSNLQNISGTQDCLSQSRLAQGQASLSLPSLAQMQGLGSSQYQPPTYTPPVSPANPTFWKPEVNHYWQLLKRDFSHLMLALVEQFKPIDILAVLVLAAIPRTLHGIVFSARQYVLLKVFRWSWVISRQSSSAYLRGCQKSPSSWEKSSMMKTYTQTLHP